jgi:hypothetical protein
MNMENDLRVSMSNSDPSPSPDCMMYPLRETASHSDLEEQSRPQHVHSAAPGPLATGWQIQAGG